MKKLIIILVIFIGSSCSDSKKIYDVTGVVLDINLDNKKILIDRAVVWSHGRTPHVLGQSFA